MADFLAAYGIGQHGKTSPQVWLRIITARYTGWPHRLDRSIRGTWSSILWNLFLTGFRFRNFGSVKENVGVHG